jgi:hypothetical protein
MSFRHRPAGPAGSPAGPAVLALLVVTVVGLVVALAGCGGSGVKPRTWAQSVCTSLSPWRARSAELTTAAQAQISATKTPAQTKESLLALLSGLEQASESARHGIERAGVPDVDGGDKIASRFLATLQRARDAYGHARTSLATLDTSNSKAFYDHVGDVFSTLNDEYAASGFDPTKVNSAELQRAFAQVEECR